MSTVAQSLSQVGQVDYYTGRVIASRNYSNSTRFFNAVLITKTDTWFCFVSQLQFRSFDLQQAVRFSALLKPIDQSLHTNFCRTTKTKRYGLFLQICQCFTLTSKLPVKSNFSKLQRPIKRACPKADKLPDVSYIMYCDSS